MFLALICTRKQLSGAASGLRFLHQNRLVHGSLRPVCKAPSLLTRTNVINRVVYSSMTMVQLDWLLQVAAQSWPYLAPQLRDMYNLRLTETSTTTGIWGRKSFRSMSLIVVTSTRFLQRKRTMCTEWAWLSMKWVRTVRYSSDPKAESHVDLLGLDGECTVLRMGQYRDTRKGTGRRTSTKTLRDRRHGLGVPSEMLGQGSYKTPVNRSSLRCPLTILLSSKIHTHPRGTVGDGATGEGEVAAYEHQSFVRQVETAAVFRQVKVREQGVHEFTDEGFGYFG